MTTTAPTISMTPPPSSRGALQMIDPNRNDMHNLRNDPPTPAKGNGNTATTPQKMHNIANRRTTTPNCHTKTPRTPKTTTPGGVVRTPGRTPKGRLPSPLPIQKRKHEGTTLPTHNHIHQHHAATTKDQRWLRFDGVCEERVGEDIDGNLCDLGIQEWAVSDFEYVRKLGKGGVADVFLAKEKQSGFEVALKVQAADDNAVCEMDLHRSLTMKQHHPNIVTMIGYFYSFETFGPCDADEQESHLYDEPADAFSQNTKSRQALLLYMILEVCDEGSLHYVIDMAPDCALPESQASKLLIDAICAMEYLHSQGIIHCDCKPANFLMGQGRVKLADFGMSVRANNRQVIGGSPVYMAPEHLLAWRHKTDRFDHRTDIYSLGVVLYELLVGYLPYEVKEAPKTMGNSVADEDFELQERPNSYSIMEDLNDLSIDDDEDMWPVLDLRKLHDHASDEPFYIPPPIFVEEISKEAEDLVNRLMEPSLSKRITLAEAKEHPWFQKFIGIE
jgi:serine/threonine protein kinase